MGGGGELYLKFFISYHDFLEFLLEQLVHWVQEVRLDIQFLHVQRESAVSAVSLLFEDSYQS